MSSTHADRRILSRLSISILSAGVFLAAGAFSALAFDPYPGKQPTKSANSPTVLAGGDIIWTVTIHNDFYATEIGVPGFWDDVPDPVDGLPVRPWTVADIISQPPGAVPTYNGDSLSYNGIVVPGRGSVDIVFRTRVDPAAANGTQICNQVWLRYDVDACTTGIPPLCDTVTYESGTRPPGGTVPERTCVTVNAPVAGPDLQAATASSFIFDSCPVDPGFPRSDLRLAPGETVDLTLALSNQGATNAVATPAPPIRGALRPGLGFTIVTGTSTYSTSVVANTLLALGGNVGSNDTPFVIRIDPDFACPGNLTVDLDVTNVTGGPWRIPYTFAVDSCTPRCVNAALSAQLTTIRDSCAITPPGINSRIDPGDDVYLILPVRNAGPEGIGGAPIIRGTLTSLTPGVTVIPGFAGADYPAMPALGTAANFTEFGIQVAESMACGSAIDLRVDLVTDAGNRSVNFKLAVADPCTACVASACVATPVAVATGKTEYCEGDSVTLDATASTVVGCLVPAAYQWYEGGTLIPGATLATYGVPALLTPGDYSYTVEVSCPADPTCTAISTTVDLTVAPQPLVVNRLMGVKSAADADFTWDVEPTAMGGYRLYKTEAKADIPNARFGTPGVTEVGTTTADVNDTALSDVGAIAGPPNLFYYQDLALCIDRILEGPND